MKLIKREFLQFPLVLSAVIIGTLCIMIIAVLIYKKRRNALAKTEISFQKPKSPDLSLDSEIANGSFGTVWQGIWKGQTVAVKTMKFPGNNAQTEVLMQMFVREAKSMFEMKHSRIVNFIDIDAESFSIIMELLPLGSLYGYINKNSSNSENFPWLDRYQVMLDICEGMTFLHSKKFLDGTPKMDLFHQDLKSANIILHEENRKLRAKIGDFGMARLRETSVGTSRRGMSELSAVTYIGGTPEYQAPEILQKPTKFTKPADVYASGIIFLELVSMRNPKQLYQLLYPEILDKGLPRSIDFCINGSLQPAPTDRPRFLEMYRTLLDDAADVAKFSKDRKRTEKISGLVNSCFYGSCRQRSLSVVGVEDVDLHRGENAQNSV